MKRIRKLEKACPKLYAWGTGHEVTGASGGELGGKGKPGRIQLGPAHPDDSSLAFDHGPVFPGYAHHVEAVQNLCNFLGTPAIPQGYPIAGFPIP